MAWCQEEVRRVWSETGAAKSSRRDTPHARLAIPFPVMPLVNTMFV